MAATLAAIAPDARDVEQLWTLARLLVNEKQTAHAVLCLELCISAPPSTEIALQANILLAECCLALCQSDPQKRARELWWKRYKHAERCVYTADQASDVGGSVVWGARLRKCKYLLVRFAKSDVAIKNRQLLESLCEGLRWCYDAANACESDEAETSALRVYFLAELRGALVKMHSQTMLQHQPATQQQTQPPATHGALAAFEENLKIVRMSMPAAVDPSFQLWLIEVSCHVLVASSRFGSMNEATNALAFADRWISSQPTVPPSLKLYHLIVKSFLVLRSGEIKKLGPLVEELKVVRAEATSSDPLANEPFLDSIVDSLELEAASRFDPCQAVALSMKAIHRVQGNLQAYAHRADIHLLLLGLLFDMLFIHCELHCQQSRYYEMGVSIAQLLKLLRAYNQHLEPTEMASYYVARVHLLIAKVSQHAKAMIGRVKIWVTDLHLLLGSMQYSFAVGHGREGEAHVRTVVQQYLPAIRPEENAYPLPSIRLWVDALDAAMYCSGVSNTTAPTAQSQSHPGVVIQQICPTAAQLNLAAQILTVGNLRDTLCNCGNVELRSKFDLALCKWMWATQELSSRPEARGLRPNPSLELLRPDMLRLLHESLQLVSGHVNCNEGTAEIMALFGPKLIEAGRPDDGEDTLKSALRLSLVAKNTLLQSRLLVDIFRLYSYRQLVQAQATTAEKYEKKIAQLQRRIAQAQSDRATTATIFAWPTQTS